MKTGKFNSASLLNKLGKASKVEKGAKIVEDFRPEVVTARQVNKFTLNASASKLIGAGAGDHVDILVIPDADSINERFIIVKSTEAQGGSKLACATKREGVGHVQNFNKSVVWSQMINTENANAEPMDKKGLIHAGLVKKTYTETDPKTGKEYFTDLAMHTVGYEVVKIGDNVEMAGEVWAEAFVLCDPRVTKYDEKIAPSLKAVEASKEEGEATEADVEAVNEEVPVQEI